MNRLLTRILSVGLAGLILAATAAPALAAEEPARDPSALRDGRCAEAWRAFSNDPTIAEGITLGDCEIDRRIDDLGKVRARVVGSSVMTEGHKTTVLRIIDGTTKGLRELRAEIHGDTSLAELTADLRRIAHDFRVYVLVIPQVHLTNASDAVMAIGKRFDAFDAKATGYIERAQEAGYDTTKAEEALASMNRHVAAAEELVDGLADRILTLTPATWNDGTAKPILDEARRDLREARELLRQARADAKAVLEALRALRD